MKINDSNSAFKSENSFKKESAAKISLLECPRGGGNCKNQLDVINKSYDQSALHLYEKNYLEAINVLTHAYVKAGELDDQSCNACTTFFRTTIVESLKEMHHELHKLTSGSLQNKRYKEIYNKADHLIKEWEKSE